MYVSWLEQHVSRTVTVEIKGYRNFHSSPAQGEFEKKFPSIAEMACREQWFAVRNLIRRQVIASSEFADPFAGKTAALWAEHYQNVAMAKELKYYVSTHPSSFALYTYIQ